MATLETLVVCDRAVRNPETKKWTLEGLFDVIWVERFPAAHASMDVFVRIRDAGAEPGTSGTVSLSIAVRGPEGTSASTPEQTITIGPNGAGEAVIRLQRLPFPVRGTYRLEAVVGGVPLGGSVLTAAQARTPDDAVH